MKQSTTFKNIFMIFKENLERYEDFYEHIEYW
jgi:hypothetical protein